MKTSRAFLLLGLLTLAACGAAPTPTTLPVPVATPERALISYGLYELNVTGMNTEKPAATVTSSSLHAQTSEVGGLEFTPLSFGTYTDEQTRMRYVRASFKVKNNAG
ncbi:MAG: hypothetical protein Q4C67_10175, partial [Deinococcus sp.]|nr:hypothetical protein [Deinococcus sp.]